MCGRTGSLLTLCFTIIFASPHTAAQEVSLPIDASQAIEANDWPMVAKLLQPHIASNPSEPISYWYGVAQFELGNTPAAITHLRIALTANPQSLVCAQYLARCAVLSNDTDSLDKLAEAFPIDADIALQAGKAWMAKYYPAKEKSGEFYYQIEPEPVKCIGKAKKYFARAVYFNDDQAEAHRMYAFALYEGIISAPAIPEIRKAISLAPMGWDSYALLADCLENKGYYADAAEAFRSAAELAPHKRSFIEFKRGKALINAQQYSQAVEAFRVVMQLDFNHRSVRFWLGKAAFGAGDYRLALWAFVEARAVDKAADPVFWVGRCSYELGHFEDAERLMHEAINTVKEYGFTHPTIWEHYLGRAQWKLKKYEEAMKSLQAAFKNDSDDLIYARWVFQGHLEMDDPYAAIKVCEKLAREGYPEVAIEGIKAVIKKWPKPRPEDLKAGQRIPHTLIASDTLTQIEYEAGHFRIAAMMYEAGGRHKGRRVHPDAGWAMLAAGDLRGASTAFRSLAQINKGYWGDVGKLGGGCVLALRGYNEQAEKLILAIKSQAIGHDRDTVACWLLIANKNPSARRFADRITLLGAVSLLPEYQGLKIKAIMPGSLLDSASVKIRPGDKIRSIGGNYIHDIKDVLDQRNARIPEQPVEIIVRRGDLDFAILVDYIEAYRKIAPANPDAEDKEDR